MAQFIATPHDAAGNVVAVSSGTGLKTMLQVNVPSAMMMMIAGWGVSIAGTVASDVPFNAYLMEGDVAASVGTSLTPDAFEMGGFGASAMIGGAALTCYAPGTEGTITASRFFDSQRVHPQTGYSVWFPADFRPMAGLVASARFVRIRVNATTTAYNVVPWIVWNE